MVRRAWITAGVLGALFVVGLGSPASGQQAGTGHPVYLRVLLPQEDVEVQIDGVVTKQTGDERLYVSPALTPGRTFTYNVSATWDPNGYTTITRSRKVAVQGGKEVVVDLRSPSAKEPDNVVVIYVPTPQEVVEAMCKLANVTKDDVVYDLGCGDGRMVITAVKDFGAKRGVGVDLDPERVKDSNANKEKAGVGDRVEFRQGDVLKIKDLADANVVLLYMGEDINLMLRPILQQTLKPGSRIVSHRFTMGDWKPAQTLQYTSMTGGVYDLHLWVIDGKK
jgi:uncharacterized protein (TIGR03000 family)